MVHPIIKLNDKTLLETIKRYNDEHGYSPTIRELAKIEKVAVETVHKHLKQLISDGYIKIEPPKRRVLKVLKDYV
ncbi:MAG: LexA family protein [Bacillota bacterium]